MSFAFGAGYAICDGLNSLGSGKLRGTAETLKRY